MSGDKQGNNNRKAAGKSRVKSAGVAFNADGRIGRRVHRGPTRATRPVASEAMPMLRPLSDREIPGPKALMSAVEIQEPPAPVPVWLAVLLATRCQARGSGEAHDVRWNCSSGRALYTNAKAHAERIEPLGVILAEGHTLAVCWTPGETTYSMEVFRQYNQCA